MSKKQDITLNQLTNIKPVTDSQKQVFDTFDVIKLHIIIAAH